MKVKLEILTPVHISSGAELSPSEYYIDRKTNELKVVNLNSLFGDPDFKKYQQSFIEKASTSRYLGEIIPDDNLLSRHVLYSLPTSLEFRSANKINIKTFIKSAGRVYVPGSSIKGAIISALFYRALLDISGEGGNKKIATYLTRSDREAYNDLLNLCYKYLWNKANSRIPVNREDWEMKFLSLFSVSDANLLEPQKCLRADICYVVGGKSSRSIPIMYETLRNGTVFEFELKNINCRFSEEKILKICDDFYRKVAGKERIERPENPYLIRLGQGSSRFAVSFLIAAEELKISEYSRKIRPPQTRKRIKYGAEIEMGFARMEVTS